VRKALAVLLALWLGGPAFTPAWADGTIDTLSPGTTLGGTEQIPMFQTANPAVTTTPAAISTYLSGTTQTFTNKTITSSTDSLGGVTAAFGSDAKGDIYQNGGSSNVLGRLGIGAAGTMLQPSSGLLAYTANPAVTGSMTDFSGTAIPSGGTQDVGYLFSSTAHFGVFFGTGAPTSSQAEGSLYLRNDNGTVYVNNNGTTGWTALGSGGGANPCSTTASAIQYEASSTTFGCVSNWTSDATNILAASAATLGWNADTLLNRGGAAGILVLSDTTTPTTFRVYNTVDTPTGPTNYERGVLDWSTTSNVLLVGTQKGGTGSVRNMEFIIGGTNKADYGVTNAGAWTFVGNTYISNLSSVGTINNFGTASISLLTGSTGGGAPGAIIIQAGNNGGSSGSANGGSINITSGNGPTGAGTGNGGNIALTLGTSTGGSAGRFSINGSNGVTCSGALTVIASITITNGIITAATGTGGTCS
jgi:hypothetical protein